MKTKELISALCGYLPYNIKVDYVYNITLTEVREIKNALLTPSILDRYMIIQESWYDNIVSITPRLRKMSSMTEDEKAEYNQLINKYCASNPESANNMTEWLNEHHLDYRGLIEDGLAVEDIKPHEAIKEPMYKIANIMFEITKINSGGKIEPNFSMQQIFDCYDAFEESDEKGREYYKKLEEYVKENGSPECKGLMYSPKI